MELLLTANHSTQFLAKELHRELPEVRVREAEYDSIVPTLLSAEPNGAVWVLIDTLNLRNQFYSLDANHRANFGSDWLSQLEGGIVVARDNHTQICLTAPPPTANSTTHGALRPDQFEFHLKAMRDGLLVLAEHNAHVTTLDLAQLVMHH